MGFTTLWRPESFQGRQKKRDYFEGWYFKIIDRDRKTVIAVIPGISVGKNGEEPHAFIQVIDAVRGTTQYHRFEREQLLADKKRLDLHLGDNHFTDKGICLRLGSGSQSLEGELNFTNIVKYPQSFLTPGIMGPFSFVPGMECYHGVVNISHTIEGTLTINGVPVDFTGGEGYIEKDWGSSFPEAWIWLQANHFETAGDSFMFSVARIPWLGRSFRGLIAFLRTQKGFYKFATYNGGKIAAIRLEGSDLQAQLRNRRHTLTFNARYAKGGILKAPKNGLMHREIEESITASIDVTLYDRKGNIIFQGSSDRTGMEIAGSLHEIL
jgi:tocopherol cyclase